MHSFYRRVRLNGLWNKILEHFIKLTRQRAGLSEEATQALIDSQKFVDNVTLTTLKVAEQFVDQLANRSDNVNQIGCNVTLLYST